MNAERKDQEEQAAGESQPWWTLGLSMTESPDS